MASINKRLKVKIVIRICTYCQIFSPQYSISIELIDSSFLDKYIKQRLVNLTVQRNQFTPLKVGLCQEINGGFTFSRCLNGTFP